MAESTSAKQQAERSDRFAAFTGWELQCLSNAVNGLGHGNLPPEQRLAQERLMDELHVEWETREDLGFSDPDATRESSQT